MKVVFSRHLHHVIYQEIRDTQLKVFFYGHTKRNKNIFFFSNSYSCII